MVAGATSAPWWLLLAVLPGGGAVGLLLSRQLVTASYRLEDEQSRPRRGLPWVVTLAVPVLWVLLAWRLGGLGSGAVLPAYLLFAVVGVALVWIDLDVHRLPEGLTLPSVPALLALLAVGAVTSGEYGALLRAGLCGVGLWAGYLLLAVASPGALGLGDATVGGLVGMMAGFLDWRAAVVATVAAFVVGGVVSLALLVTRRVTMKTHIAFGPFILLGALAAVLVHVPAPGT